jgi:hypothetical protein
MAKLRHYQLDIYGVWLHSATTRKAWRKLRNQIDSLPRITDGALGFTSRDVEDGGDVHISLFIDAARLVDNPQGLTEILAHEAAHAGCMLLDHIDQEYDGQSEAMAYLVGFIAAWTWEAVAEAR